MTEANNRSRLEIVALWAQAVLVFGEALSIAQGAVTLDQPGDGHGWVLYLPLLCVLPSVAAFRTTRAASSAMLAGAVVSFAGFFWFDGMRGTSLLYALSLAWPLLAASALLGWCLRTRRARLQEASLLHRHARANRLELEESEACGCLACERIYSPTDIVDWIATPHGESAVCPHCGVDSVVGSASGIPITPGVLQRAHAQWFLAG